MSVVLLIALLSGTAVASDVSVTAKPARCLLGRDRAVQITVHAGPKAVAARLSANSGTVSRATKIAPGTFSATYVPPGQLYPRNALIGAVVDVGGEEHAGWLLLPLWGQGRAKAKTRAFGKATVRIADRTFGPVRADARGVASIEIEAPPGIRFAYDGRRKIDLRIPATSNVHVFAGRPPKAADVASRVPVWVVAVSPTGEPRRKPPTLKSSRGRLSAPVELAPGLFRTTLALDAGPAGAVVVTAVQADQPHLPARLSIEAPPGAAARAVLAVHPASVVAGATSTVQITGRIVDAADNPVAQPVEVAASVGRLEPDPHPRPGVVHAVLHLPAYFAGHDTVEIRLHSAGTSVKATARLALRPAPAKALRLLTPRTPLRASGQPQAIRVQVVDAFGNLAPAHDPPHLQARHGTVGSVRRVSAGSFVADYVPQRYLGREQDVIEAHAKALSGATSTLQLIEGASRVDAGAQVGFLLTSHRGLAPSVSLGGAYWFTVGAFDLGPRVDVTYVHLQRTARLTSGSADMTAESRQELTTAMVGAGARVPITSALSVHLRIGAGGCWVSSKLTLHGSPYPAQDALVWTAGAAAGAGMRLGVGELTVTVAYRWWAAPGLSSAAGALSAVMPSVGYEVAVW